MPNGNILAFGQHEKDKVFNYWGQNTKIVPYLVNNSKPGDKVIAVSEPSGLAYYTNLRVFNLEHGGGLSLFQPIFGETDNEKIYMFYKTNNIKFVAVRNFGKSSEKFSNLKKETRIFDLLDDIQYAKLVIIPDNSVHWFLYEIL